MPLGKCFSGILDQKDTLQWRHNEYHGILNYQQVACLFNRLLKRALKKTSKYMYWPFVREIHQGPEDSLTKGQ